MRDGGCGMCRSTSSGPVRRPSTRARRTTRSGSTRLAGTLPLAPEFDVEVSAVLESGRAAPIALVRGRRAPLRIARFEPQRNPVTVTTLGRTGSMLLMRVLAAHPEVLVYRPHRFEQRIASYWADVLLSLAEPAGYIRQIAPPPDVDDPAWWLGREAPDALGAARHARAGMARRARRSRTSRSPASSASRRSTTASSRPRTRRDAAAVRGEVEPARGRTAVGAVPRLARDLPGARLPRHGELDPVVQREAGRRRVRARGRGQRCRLRVVAGRRGPPGLLRAWERRRGSAHLVRYEDLVLDQERTVAGLLDYLGVDSGAETVAALRASDRRGAARAGDHATSDGPRGLRRALAARPQRRARASSASARSRRR